MLLLTHTLPAPELPPGCIVERYGDTHHDMLSLRDRTLIETDEWDERRNTRQIMS